jgi:hypothetical protein
MSIGNDCMFPFDPLTLEVPIGAQRERAVLGVDQQGAVDRAARRRGGCVDRADRPCTEQLAIRAIIGR